MPPEAGIRLSKRVMAEAGCSRAEAERLIAAGAVRVDGQVATEPAQRVDAMQAVAVDRSREALGGGPLTLLWHKPAGASTAPAQARGLRCATPLPEPASGLVVYTQNPGVWRVLTESQPPLEQEWLVDLPGAVAASALGPGVRASVGSQNAERTRLRLVARGAWQTPATLQPLRVLRQRVGRIALGPLAEGEVRPLGPHERF